MSLRKPEWRIPELSMVLLIGPSGSGKSSFARKHFLPSEIVSSDACREMVCDDETDQSATKAAFDLVFAILEKRFELGKLCVVDATNVQPESRAKLISIAKKYHVLPVAVVFDFPAEVCIQRNEQRSNRNFGPHVVRNQLREMRSGLRMLRREGIKNVITVSSHEEVDSVTVLREPLWNNRSELVGPFDIIGDIHGCYDELISLVTELGYVETDGIYIHPQVRTLAFVGDLVDRGPKTPEVLEFVMRHCELAGALCVPGNHDVKLLKHLQGKPVSVSHGLAESLVQLESRIEEFKNKVSTFIEGLVSHLVLDQKRLVIAHAGMPESMIGRGSSRVREFALYGETTGETDEFGLPVRYQWAQEYRGGALVVYGHTPVLEPDWLNNTCCIDTGCVFGGSLTALRYPEKETVSVPAQQVYSEPIRPIGASPIISSQHLADDVLNIAEVRGRQHIRTALRGTVLIREENSTAALEIMGRFAANPKWLVYLPPTMSPTETSQEEGFLEYPTEAFDYFRNQGIQTVVCEEKHMGSRAVIVLGRNDEAIQRRFGIVNEGIGTILTRTGRPFFDSRTPEQQILNRLASAMESTGLWKELETDWVVLDCELMPWSAKAQGLLKSQYAPVATAAKSILQRKEEILNLLATINSEWNENLLDARAAQESIEKYQKAYRNYCWSVKSIDDYQIAPFHILATEQGVHHQKNHLWHMDVITKLHEGEPTLLKVTPYRLVDLNDQQSVDGATEWWRSLVSIGGEGMVIKPLEFTVKGVKGLVQPALKCRGPEYLRIIYGPEYLNPQNLVRLRKRSVGAKRALALKEYALGIEALERFHRKEPLRNVHQCVFGVLALESEPVDSRL